MDLKFAVSARISRPVSEVFEAVADPQKLSNYFTTGGAKGRLESGVTVSWDFHDFPGAFPVEVVEVERDRKIVLRWEANEVTVGAVDVESTAVSCCRFHGHQVSLPQLSSRSPWG